jgi:hypothetical protein
MTLAASFGGMSFLSLLFVWLKGASARRCKMRIYCENTPSLVNMKYSELLNLVHPSGMSTEKFCGADVEELPARQLGAKAMSKKRNRNINFLMRKFPFL